MSSLVSILSLLLFIHHPLIFSVKNPFRSKSPPPPATLNVLVFPANGLLPYRTALPLIETPIRPVVRPTDQHHEHIFRTASASSMMYHYKESACEPNIRFLPDAVLGGHWDQRAWEKRCVVGTAKMHFFYTTCKDGFGYKNITFDNVVHSDVFMLKVSDSTDEEGLNFYVDFEPEDCVEEVLLDLGRKLFDQEKDSGRSNGGIEVGDRLF